MHRGRDRFVRMFTRVALGVLLVFGLAYLILGQQMILVPSEPVHLVADLESRNSTDPKDILAIVPAGEPMSVTACRNLVDDQVYRIKTNAGVEGYVAHGKFVLERKPLWEPPRGPVVFCY